MTEPASTARDGRDVMRRARADLRAMKRIAKDWNTLTDAGKKFMLSALSAGRKDADRDQS